MSFGVSVPRPGDGDLRLAIRIEGPFDSSYSLARINRELALALAASGADIGLYSTEGPGDFEPDAGFLSDHPEVEKLFHHGRELADAGVIIRNLYPPRVTDMRGTLRGLAVFNWEESVLPHAWVQAFNANLDFIAVSSQYVQKVLVDNGVHVPIEVVGLGLDHHVVLKGEGRLTDLPGGFRFLHVSSGFPRKGLDVLFEAWARAFSREDDVALIIKTFANPHNEVAGLLKGVSARFPSMAPVILIEEDLSDADLRELYADCHALVAPSRGEGFGFPLAEAMLFGLPVIATAYGGQSDFCTPTTAWLVGCDFSFSRSHHELSDSLWQEPDLADLVGCLRQVQTATPAERAARTAAARRLVESRYTWERVGRGVLHCITRARHMPPSLPLRVAWVSTWNTRCGIATYSRFLAGAMSGVDLRMLAPVAAQTELPDEPWVVRCWRQEWSDSLERLEDTLQLQAPDAVVIQFNFAFFHLSALERVLNALKLRRIPVILFLHGTKGIRRKRLQVSLESIVGGLQGVFRICVHTVHDVNHLKSMGLVDNVTLFPHGVSSPEQRSLPHRPEEMVGRRVVASYGFLLPHKGLCPLIRAFASLRGRYHDLHLLLVNAHHEDPVSVEEEARCRALIDELGLSAHVTAVFDFLPDEQSLAWLSLADLIVFPYQYTEESASGAVRIGIAADRPVAVTPLAIFDDVADVVEYLPGSQPEEIAAGIASLLDDPARLGHCLNRQRQWCASHAWPLLATRLNGMLQAACRRATWFGEAAPLAAHDRGATPHA